MKKGELNSAIRRALNLFDEWNDVTGFVTKHTSYYYELQAVIEDAVHCGAQQALNIYEPLTDSERERSAPPPQPVAEEGGVDD